jgi:transcriptional regulator with XRE-family HTH domain
MTKTTSPYLDFAKNLRTMTEQRGTIAQVCRELGMNRQQFNKYLSGTSLPAPQTLEKIARYFGVDQHAMFDRDDSPDVKSWTKGMHPLFMLGQLDERVLRKFVDTLAFSSKTQLKEGCYLIYYPWPLVPTEILRATMVVFRVGNVMCFRRYTRFAMKEQPLVQSARERDEGIVLELSGRTFLISKNIRASGELSLYSFAATTTADLGIMSGLALVFSHWAEPLATRVTIDYFGPKDAFRRALRLCGVVPDTVSGISETIKRSVLEPVSFPTAHLLPFQIFDSIRT